MDDARNEVDLRERLASLEAENRELRTMLESRQQAVMPGVDPRPIIPAGERRRRRRIKHWFFGAMLAFLAVGGGSTFLLRRVEPAADPFEDVRNASAGYPAFEVQLGSFQYRPHADELVQRLRAERIRATMLTTPGNLNRVVVRLGPYRTRDEAEAVRAQAVRNGWFSNGTPTIVAARSLSPVQQ